MSTEILDLKKLAQILQSYGRNGDTILAHINEGEAAHLKRMGGAGTRNPETGLLEFGGYEGEGTSLGGGFNSDGNHFGTAATETRGFGVSPSLAGRVTDAYSNLGTFGQLAMGAWGKVGNSIASSMPSVGIDQVGDENFANNNSGGENSNFTEGVAAGGAPFTDTTGAAPNAMAGMPDYSNLSPADKAYMQSRDAAVFNSQLNRVDQVGPDGSQTWSQGPAGADGSPGRWTQTTALSGANQSLYDQKQTIAQGLANATGGALQRTTDALANPLDTSGLTARGAGPNASDFSTDNIDMGPVFEYMNQKGPAIRAGSAAASGATAGQAALAGPIQREFDRSGVTTTLPSSIDDTSRRRVEEALMSRINPLYQADEGRLRTRLLNSGIEVGTNAYNHEMNNFSQRLNDARMQAVMQGGAEESRQVGLLQGINNQQFGQALSVGKFGQDADTTIHNNTTQTNVANANAATQASIASAANANAAAIANARNETESSMASASLAQRQRESVAHALTEAQRLQLSTNAQNFNQAGTAAAFSNQTRDAELNELLGLRQQPLNELNALRTGSAPVMPNFGNVYTGGTATAGDQVGAARTIAQSQSDAAARSDKKDSDMLGGLGEIISMFF